MENSSIPGGMPLAGIRDTAKNALKQRNLKNKQAKSKGRGFESVKQVFHENSALIQAKDNLSMDICELAIEIVFAL